MNTAPVYLDFYLNRLKKDGVKSIFDTKAPSVPAGLYLVKTCAYITTEDVWQIHAVVILYLQRFSYRTGILITRRNVYGLLLIASMIAGKMYDDEPYDNIDWAEAVQFDLKRINAMERIFLHHINYQTMIQPDVIAACHNYMRRYICRKT